MSDDRQDISAGLGAPARPSPEHVTRLLDLAASGDARATEQLFPLVYDELRRLAAALMAREQPGQTLQPTALVNEAYLRLVGPGDVRWQSRAHFFGAAANAMRRVLIDRARQVRGRHRREAQVAAGRSDLDSRVDESTPDDLIALDGALGQLAQRDQRQHQVAMLRFFAGLTVEQTAEVMGVSPATVKSDWAFARAWLTREVAKQRAGA
jgi:RNA polymerase sigma factor (TIGR02999 family)